MGEFLNCRIALGAALTVLLQEVLGESYDLESLVTTTNIVTVFNLVTKGTHFAREDVAIDLGQIAAPLVQTRRLQCFPTTFGAIVGKIGSDGMSVELRVQLSAGVVGVCGHNPVSGCSIFVQASEANPSRRVFLCFFQGLAHSGFVRGDQSLITANNGHDRDGLRRRECHVIEGAALALFRAIAGNAIRAVTLAEKLSRSRVETLPCRFKILRRNLPFEPKQFSAASVPLAFDSAILVVIIALLEMALCVALPAGHGTNRQHTPTLALFEDRNQGSLAAFVPTGRELSCVSIQRELRAIWSDFTDGNPQPTPLAFPQADLADDALRCRQALVRGLSGPAQWRQQARLRVATTPAR